MIGKEFHLKCFSKNNKLLMKLHVPGVREEFFLGVREEVWRECCEAVLSLPLPKSKPLKTVNAGSHKDHITQKSSTTLFSSTQLFPCCHFSFISMTGCGGLSTSSLAYKHDKESLATKCQIDSRTKYFVSFNNEH